mmetsp:Transcript_52114/g.77218  ORF Transcript_52114/g.77218 Transcript_52114/m.77218 type:complete len:89 (-) Transcript_52114:24-290(-)
MDCGTASINFRDAATTSAKVAVVCTARRQQSAGSVVICVADASTTIGRTSSACVAIAIAAEADKGKQAATTAEAQGSTGAIHNSIPSS